MFEIISHVDSETEVLGLLHLINLSLLRCLQYALLTRAVVAEHSLPALRHPTCSDLASFHVL